MVKQQTTSFLSKVYIVLNDLLYRDSNNVVNIDNYDLYNN